MNKMNANGHTVFQPAETSVLHKQLPPIDWLCVVVWGGGLSAGAAMLWGLTMLVWALLHR